MDDGRHRKRRHKGLPRYSLTKIESEIRDCEEECLVYMHLAAMSFTFYDCERPRLLMERDPSYAWQNENRLEYLANALMCNIELNICCEQWSKAIKLHALVAVTFLRRWHPVFRQSDLRVVLRLIYHYASMPSYPNTRRELTVRELFADDPLRQGAIRLVLEHYDRVLPGVEF